MNRGADSREVERVYRERFHDFARIAFAITRNEELAGEAVQETFARALRSRESFRREGTVEAWLWSILVNVARSLRPRTLMEFEYVDGEGPPAPEIAARDTDFGCWVAALPERQRLAVFLRYWADLDYRAIASVLGVEVGTVSATLNAAHATLRRSLKEVS
jgi:RNA polymerase sigma-70 factor (ECF subfamily)